MYHSHEESISECSTPVFVYNHVRTGHFANNVNEFAKCHIKRIF